MKLRFLLLFWLLCSTLLWAAPGLEIEAKIEAAATPLPFGKPATLVVDLSWDEKWPFTPPPAESLELAGFTIIDSFQTEAPPTLSGDRKGVSYHVVFTRFEPGPAKLPPLNFETPSGKVAGPSLTMEYKGAEPKEGDQPDQLRAPKQALELSAKAWWLWAAKLAGATLLVLLLLGAIIRKLGYLERWLSPRARALRHLKQITQKLEQGHLQGPDTLLQMVELLRVYLARSYSLVTREATSREILTQVMMDNRCQNIKPISKTILELGDRAKFAQRQLSEEQARDLLEQLRTSLAAEKRKST